MDGDFDMLWEVGTGWSVPLGNAILRMDRFDLRRV